MSSAKKKYTLIYLICFVLLFHSFPLEILIDNFIIQSILRIIIELALIFYVLYYNKKEFFIPFKFKKISKRDIIYLPLLLLCFSNLFVIYYQRATLNENINCINLIITIIKTFTIIFVEELLFRMIVLEELYKSKNKFQTIFLSSLIFSLVHAVKISPSNIIIVLVQIGYTFILGIILGFILIDSDNLIIPIIFHFLFNFINNDLVIELFDFKNDLSFYVINIIVGIIVLIYLFFVVLLERRSEKNAP